MVGDVPMGCSCLTIRMLLLMEVWVCYHLLAQMHVFPEVHVVSIDSSRDKQVKLMMLVS
jgi:hypothetical protein